MTLPMSGSGGELFTSSSETSRFRFSYSPRSIGLFPGPRGKRFSALPQQLKTLALQEKSLGKRSRLRASHLVAAGHLLHVYTVEGSSLQAPTLPLTFL